MAKFTIDVYSDTVCPWCFIGKKTLDTAIKAHQERFPEDEFNLKWRPFILYPNAKVSAYNKKDSLALRMGPEAETFIGRMERAGAAHGITFNWGGRTGASRDSHKLILLAADLDAAAAVANPHSNGTTTAASNGPDSPPSSASTSFSLASPAPGPSVTPIDMDVDPRPETAPPSSAHPPPAYTSTPNAAATTKQDAMIFAIFDGAHSRGRDVSDRGFLVPAALELGLAGSEAELVAYLDSEEARRRVDLEMARARREVGVAAVPSYIVNGRYRVGGMQEPGVFLGLFERIRGLVVPAAAADGGGNR